MKPTRAVITGASSGIGEAFARELATQRVNLVIAARRTEQLNKLARELEENYQISVDVMTIDLEDPSAPEKLFKFATEKGNVDLLINNAGRGPYRHFLKTELFDHEKVIQLNITSLTSLCHLFAGHMIEVGKKAAILNVASVASFTPVPRYAVYCSTKSYVKAFSEILNYELKDTCVSVSCLCPGGTRTEFLEKNNQKTKVGSEKLLMPVEKVAKAGLEGTLTGKPVIIPGLLNKLSSALPSILPNKVNMFVTEKAMNIAVEERD
ncbi:MAG: SDR family NAD(P)-dependent oxidoreductase [Bacteriovoracia bacterium]